MSKFFKLLDFFWQKYPYRFLVTVLFVFSIVTGGSSFLTLSYVDGEISVTTETCQVLLDEQRQEFEATAKFIETEKAELTQQVTHLNSEIVEYRAVLEEQKKVIEELKQINHQQQTQIKELLESKKDSFWETVGA